MDKFDVVIIGGGPIGLYAAYRLGGLFSRVALLERNHILNQNNLCSGLVSDDFIKHYQLPNEILTSHYNSIELKIKSQPIGNLFVNFARINRKNLKYYFLQLSKRVGCSIFEKTDATNIFLKEGKKIIVEVNKGERILESNFLVLACGSNKSLVQKLTQVETVLKIWGSQQILPCNKCKKVEVDIGEPGSLFSWSIPIESGKVISGKLSYEPLNGNGCKLLPFFRPHNVSGKRFALLGLCAGQIKTTTAGGYSYGFWCVDKLAECISSNICLDYALANYSFETKKAVIPEFDFGILFWKLLRNNSINKILFRARLFNKLNIIPKHEVKFDWHFHSFLKRFFKKNQMSIRLQKSLSDLEIKEVNLLTNR